jgi:hypothetical protein
MRNTGSQQISSNASPPEDMAGPRPAAAMAFRTFRDGRFRTVGALAQLGAGDPVDDWSGDRAKALLQSLPEIKTSTPVAQGKLALVNPHSELPVAAVFQLSPAGCNRVFCGNGAAGVAAHLAAARKTKNPAFLLRGSGALTVTVRAAVSGITVAQVWIVPADAEISTTPAAIEVNLFNHYTVVDAASGNVAELLNDADPRRRIAAVEMRGEEPRVTFYTSGREHPSAPLTGLCILALLSNQVEWLRPLLELRCVIVHGHAEPLPAVVVGTNHLEFELPETEVTLEPICAPGEARERAA